MGAVRVIFVIIITAAPMHLHAFWLVGNQVSSFRVVLGLFFIFFEITAGKGESEAFAGGGLWFILGILGALMISHLLSLTSIDQDAKSFFKLTLLLLMAYVGLVLGANKGELLNLGALGGIFHH